MFWRCARRQTLEIFSHHHLLTRTDHISIKTKMRHYFENLCNYTFLHKILISWLVTCPWATLPMMPCAVAVSLSYINSVFLQSQDQCYKWLFRSIPCKSNHLWRLRAIYHRPFFLSGRCLLKELELQQDAEGKKERVATPVVTLQTWKKAQIQWRYFE